MDGMQKEAKLLVHDEPYLKPVTGQGISFYNMDVNTAVLTFQVKRNEYPLEISAQNTETYAFFVSSNGSTTGKVKVEFIDPLNGIIRVTLDENFLLAATNTNVKGQIYIKAIGRPDTVVLNEFTFYVKDALINQIDGSIKIKEIRLFDELETEIRNKIARINEIEQQLDTIDERTDAMLQAEIQNFKAEINTQIQDVKNFITATQQNITNKANEVDENIRTLNNNIDGTENSLVTVTKLNEILGTYATNAQIQTLNDTKANTSDVVSKSELTDIDTLIAQKVEEKFNGLAVQNYQLTDANGYIPRIDNLDMYTMNGISKSGWYYVYAPINSPEEDSNNGYLQVFARSSTYMKVIFMPYNRHKMYTRNKMGSTTGWGDWVEITSGYSVTTRSDQEAIAEDLENADANASESESLSTSESVSMSDSLSDGGSTNV